MSRILELLGLEPSAESRDYVTAKGEFQLHGLPTEQRHSRTRDLDLEAMADPEVALGSILSVDADLQARIEELAEDAAAFEPMLAAMQSALESGQRIYLYGCGATGRLAKQLESAVWRPFWRRVDQRVEVAGLPIGIGDRLVGEMTGGDRALVASLEGFEDLPELGVLQLADHAIQRGDVVICVSEGGETSSVIGTILAARRQWGELDAAGEAEARRHLHFVYNNPDERLRPFARSRAVLDEPAIHKWNLCTGPQAVAGSTRMQATTIETFVLGVLLEELCHRLLRDRVDAVALGELGFVGDPGVAGRLRDFAGIRQRVEAARTDLARLTEVESEVYAGGGRATYAAGAAMVAVFTDCAERSPTFRLAPLDEAEAAPRRSWVQVWDLGDGEGGSWRSFLGRPFRGLDPAFYGAAMNAVSDPWLRGAARRSLARAGADQELRYDFSMSASNLADGAPCGGELGVLVLVDDERAELEREGSAAARFVGLCGAARLAVIRLGDAEGMRSVSADAVVDLVFELRGDPLQLRRQIALKILLNAHSTSTMARLGRLVGNTMTHVSPSNLKLIGRATFLIQSHVNDLLGEGAIRYAEANAVLFDAIDWSRRRAGAEAAEVALSIVRIIESFEGGVATGFDEVEALLEAEGLAGYLRRRRSATEAPPGD